MEKEVKEVENVQLLDTCRKWSIYHSRHNKVTCIRYSIHVADTCSAFGYRRHVERSVHTGATCRILHVECRHVDSVDELLGLDNR